MSNPVNIFFIYARTDKVFKDRIIKELALQIRDGSVTVWNDDQILPGEKWEDEIAENLGKADIILALISADFLASPYIQNEELEKAFERQKKGEVEIIPIILRACGWENDLRFKNLQAIPDDGKPVNTWTPEDNAYFSIGKGIQNKISDIQARRRKEEEDKIARAKEMLQQKEWEYAQNKGTVTAYREYVERFQPDLLHQDEVFRELSLIKEEIDYTMACVRHTPEAYDNYLKSYQKSQPQFEKQAKDRMLIAKTQPGKPLALPSVGARPAANQPASDTVSEPPAATASRFPDWAKYTSVAALLLLLYLIFRPAPMPASPDQSELAWKKTLETDTKKAYEAYQFSFQNGGHFKEAGDSVQAIQKFVTYHLKKANNVKFSPENARAEVKLALDRDPENIDAKMLWEELK